MVVSIHPEQISIDRVENVVLCFTNAGPGSCTNVRFTFRMPKEILLVRGKRQLHIACLKEGESYEYPLQVKAKETGDFSITSTNFSYRDLAGRSRRVQMTMLPLHVVKPAALPNAPSPSIELSLDSGIVPYSVWTSLTGSLSNTGLTTIQNIHLFAEGPALQSREELLGSLSPGQTLPFILSIHASEDGTRVPICLKAQFQDAAGKSYFYDSPHYLVVEKNRSEDNDTKSSKRGEYSMIKILFLAANPSDSARLRLDEESRMIDKAVRQAEFRDLFDIRTHWAVRVGDIQELLLRHKPDIVHFSGHGNEANEIVLEDNSGKNFSVSIEALSQLFSLLKDNIRCVVLNACYSEAQAQAIAKYIDCVVGMSNSIKDSMSISFASAFYQALGYGRDLKTAFDLGCLQIDLDKLGKADIPQLVCTLTDPSEVVLVNP